MTGVSHNPDERLLADLSDRLTVGLEGIAKNGNRVALVGFPNHNNSGDSAIWLGELAFFRRQGIEVGYICDDASYHPRDLDRSVPQGTILLHGGGNLGDLWPVHQALRERVLADHPDRSVIQLPQTVTVRDPAVLYRLASIASTRSGDFVVHARDLNSFGLLEKVGLDAKLTPDMAFALGALARQGIARHDVVAVRRRDHERAAADVHLSGGLSVYDTDWLDTSRTRWRRRISVRTREAARGLASRSGSDRLAGRLVRRTPLLASEELAWARMRTAMRVLSSGRVVLTDRLHGHIISLLLGQPHVLMDDKHGKVRSFHEAFTSSSVLAHMTSNWADVGTEVDSLLRRVRG